MAMIQQRGRMNAGIREERAWRFHERKWDLVYEWGGWLSVGAWSVEWGGTESLWKFSALCFNCFSEVGSKVITETGNEEEDDRGLKTGEKEWNRLLEFRRLKGRRDCCAALRPTWGMWSWIWSETVRVALWFFSSRIHLLMCKCSHDGELNSTRAVVLPWNEERREQQGNWGCVCESGFNN